MVPGIYLGGHEAAVAEVATGGLQQARCWGAGGRQRGRCGLALQALEQRV